VSAQVTEQPFVNDPAISMTIIKGEFGFLCISTRVPCEGRGYPGSEVEEKTIRTADGDWKLQIGRSRELNRSGIKVTPLFAPSQWDGGGINAETTIIGEKDVEAMVASIDFK
jgi:hypothetical protein